jgi:hypothetical protein
MNYCQEERLIRSQTVHGFTGLTLMQRQKCKLTYLMERREKRGRWEGVVLGPPSKHMQHMQASISKSGIVYFL